VLLSLFREFCLQSLKGENLASLVLYSRCLIHRLSEQRRIARAGPRSFIVILFRAPDEVLFPAERFAAPATEDFLDLRRFRLARKRFEANRANIPAK
jgi:hypothetical protein